MLFKAIENDKFDILFLIEISCYNLKYIYINFNEVTLMHIFFFYKKIQLELGKVAAGENNFLTETLNASKRLCVGVFDWTAGLQQQKPKRPKASFLKMVD